MAWRGNCEAVLREVTGGSVCPPLRLSEGRWLVTVRACARSLPTGKIVHSVRATGEISVCNALLILRYLRYEQQRNGHELAFASSRGHDS